MNVRGSISSAQAIPSPGSAWPHLCALGTREQYLPLVDQLPLQGIHEISRGCGPATVQNHFKPGNETKRITMSQRGVCLETSGD